MAFKPALNITLQIADHIGNEIILGRLAPASRIQELKVARELGVSRGSVREALLILESRHLIQIVPRKGAVVTGLQPSEIPDFCELFLDLERRACRSLLRSQHIDREAFSEAVTAMEEAAKNASLEGVLASRHTFYQSLLTLAGNTYLCSVFEALVPASQRLACMVAQHDAFDLRDMARYYRALFEALSNADIDRVEELLRPFTNRAIKLASSTDLHSGLAHAHRVGDNNGVHALDAPLASQTTHAFAGGS